MTAGSRYRVTAALPAADLRATLIRRYRRYRPRAADLPGYG